VSLTSLIKGKVIQTVVDKVAQSEPRTTGLGFVLSGIVAANIDYNKLVQGDLQQIGNLVAAVVVALLGWFTNHSKLTGGGNGQAQKQ